MCKFIATKECRATDACDVGRYCNGRKAITITERILIDTCNTVWQRNVFKTHTTIECRLADARNAIRYRNARKVTAPLESTAQNITTADCNRFQTGGDVVGAGYSGKTVRMIEIILCCCYTPGITAFAKDVTKRILVGVFYCLSSASYKRDCDACQVAAT